MRFIDKDKLLKELQKVRYIVNDDGEISYEMATIDYQAMYDFISNFKEEDVVKCDTDYWTDCYEFYTRQWYVTDDDNNKEPVRETFVIKRVK